MFEVPRKDHVSRLLGRSTVVPAGEELKDELDKYISEYSHLVSIGLIEHLEAIIESHFPVPAAARSQDNAVFVNTSLARREGAIEFTNYLRALAQVPERT